MQSRIACLKQVEEEEEEVGQGEGEPDFALSIVSAR